jgi:hypothetical protein
LEKSSWNLNSPANRPGYFFGSDRRLFGNAQFASRVAPFSEAAALLDDTIVLQVAGRVHTLL